MCPVLNGNDGREDGRRRLRFARALFSAGCAVPSGGVVFSQKKKKVAASRGMLAAVEFDSTATHVGTL